MLKNYVKITIRNLMRQKLYSFINITGLSIGIASFILISLWVYDELSFDTFHQNRHRVFRVNTVSKEMGLVTASSWRLGPAFKETYPEIEDFTRLWPWARSLVKYQDKSFDEDRFFLADPAFFKIFSFNFLYGTPEKALPNLNSLVLTRETAKKYFGDGNPLGQSVFVRRYDRDFEVTAVIDNIPSNSTIQFDLLARVDLMPRQRLESWEFTGFTCIMLQEEADAESLNKKIYSFYREHVRSDTEQYPYLQPLSQIHLYENGKPGLIKMVRYFSIIAFFILLLACINFMNLRTAKAAKRANEVGVRKVVGANRKQLITQFLTESILLSLISLVLALLIVEAVLPAFNQITGKELTISSSETDFIILFLFTVVLLTGLLAGTYPALYLSAFRPAKILKDKSLSQESGNSFRKSLTIFQFSISIGLIICVLIWSRQMDFVKNKDIGIEKNLIINIPGNPDLITKLEDYRIALLKNPRIESVTSSASTPFDIGSYIGVNWEGHLDKDEVIMPYNMVDYDFFETFGMKILQGRGFSRYIPSDGREACIINETAAGIMGLDNPLGKALYFDHPAFEESYKNVTIIGIVNDFHTHSLHREISPTIFRMHQPFLSYIYIRIHPGQITSAIDYIHEITRNFAPDYPFRFEFMDKTYNRLYEMENRMGKIINIFTFLAIFISCLGLFGLVSYTIERRTKEIGIRKVLGASALKITSMLSLEFLKWVAIANIIAWPVAWFFMNQWLDNFAYHITLSLWTFLLAGGSGILLAISTVIIQSIKAGLKNPVEALRYE